MAVKLRLKRIGTRNTPVYRIVATDGRTKRDGRPIEELGTYQPLINEIPNFSINLERVDYWLGVGAKPSDTVNSFIRKARRAAEGLPPIEPKAKKVKAKPEPKEESKPEPAEEAKAEPAEEAAAEPAEEPKAKVTEEAATQAKEEAPAEEAPAEEAPAEEAVAEPEEEDKAESDVPAGSEEKPAAEGGDKS
jgi:small subunit ribosomal protein S16